MVVRLIALDFEVFGRVQGVFFRACTREQAKKLGVFGWVQNTDRNTVVGSAQGEENKVEAMKDWLKNTGSPNSRIDKVVFTNQRQIDELTYSSFDVKK